MKGNMTRSSHCWVASIHFWSNRKYAVIGLRDWWVDSRAVAGGSAQQALEGWHYSRGLRLHKQLLESLLRTRIAQIDIAKVDGAFKEKVTALRLNPIPDTLVELMRYGQFKVFMWGVSNDDRIHEGCLPPTSTCQLCLENSIERHMQAERALLS